MICIVGARVLALVIIADLLLSFAIDIELSLSSYNLLLLSQRELCGSLALNLYYMLCCVCVCVVIVTNR